MIKEIINPNNPIINNPKIETLLIILYSSNVGFFMIFHTLPHLTTNEFMFSLKFINMKNNLCF